MVSKGLLVRLEVKPGQDAAVEELLRSAAPIVREETGTKAWWAIRFGRSEYGIFDVFADDAARDAHLTGRVAQALRERAEVLFAEPPRIEKVDILADKLPAGAAVSKALLLAFKAKEGNAAQVEEFLRGARSLVLDETKTEAWFALRLNGERYGIFDVFPDNGGRFAHLTGHVPRELAKHALSILGGVPEMHLLDVLAQAAQPATR